MKLIHTKLFQRIELQVLANTTAGAFGVKPVKLSGSLPDALQAYARFTAETLKQTQTDRQKVYAEAYKLGNRIRRYAGIRTDAQAQQMIFALYRNIGITMSGDIHDTLYVSDCYFSRYYTPQMCEVMSAMDAGIVNGIAGGQDLVFTKRITEGCGRCEACIRRKKG